MGLGVSRDCHLVVSPIRRGDIVDDCVRGWVHDGNLLPVEVSLAVMWPVLLVFAPEDGVGNYQLLVFGRQPSHLVDIVFWIEGSCERLWLDIPQIAGSRNHNLCTGRSLEECQIKMYGAAS